jgi:uncharacterized glyoxalase superfamily protein PhnB
MSDGQPGEMPQIIPYLYYEDAGPAIEFMETGFGFEIVSVFRNPEDDRVLTSTVRTGSGLIFVGPGMEFFGTQGVQDPESVSSMTYVYVADVDAHCERARAAGARITAEPHVHFGGNRQYTASDPGGQRWTFAQSGADDEVGETSAGD